MGIAAKNAPERPEPLLQFMKTSPLLLVSFLFLAIAPASRSVTIWDNGMPDLNGGAPSDSASSIQRGDDFSLAMTATAQQIQWWGFYGSAVAPADDFTISIFTITGGVSRHD
jgi:hypothetical protein